MTTKIPIIAWLNRNNVIRIELSEPGKVINHTLFTNVMLIFGTQFVQSLANPEFFDLTDTTGIVFKPAQTGVIAGSYAVRIITFDASNLLGVIWADKFIEVKQG